MVEGKPAKKSTCVLTLDMNGEGHEKEDIPSSTMHSELSKHRDRVYSGSALNYSRTIFSRPANDSIA
jgi:hypothetical protein